jgi:glutamate formiminotransferase
MIEMAMHRLVESVPNVSEGRDHTVLSALVAEIQSLRDVILLDLHSDFDHHRSVFTMAGEPEAMSTALFNLMKQAQRMIDLRSHHGHHPRIGAVDVVPWIPLKGMTMEECATYANNLGQRVGKELGIPVFLYECAGVVHSRKRLEAIRRGGLSGLQERMGQETDWKPDFGPHVLHPTAGATVIGARFFLIALNIVLKSQDIQVARLIAARIRSSGGGLPCIKAMGVRLPSRELVQVSVNLTDYRVTSLRRLFHAVEREAHLLEAEILESEVVGLIPQAAWDENLPKDLKLRKWNPDGILEIRLVQEHLFSG